MSSAGNKRKYKSNYYKSGSKKSKGGHHEEELRPNLKGFLITCGGRERDTVIEAYRILNEYAEQKYGAERIEKVVNSDEDDIENILKKQIEDINTANKAERRFQSVRNKSKNIIFIRTLIADPAQLVLDIFDDIIKTQIKKTKHCLRFLPVIQTCYAKPDHISKQTESIIEKYFHNADKSFKFCIMWKCRCNNSLKKDDIVTMLSKNIFSHEGDYKHEVSYNAPDIVLNLDIVGNICCIGIIKDFYQYKKYNIDQLIEVAKSSEDKEKKCEMRKAGDETENMDIKIEKADNEIKNSDTKIENADIENATIKIENTDVQIKNSVVKTENAEIEIGNEELDNQKADKEFWKANVEIENAEMEIEKAEKEVKKANKEIRNANREFRKANVQIENAEIEIEKAEKEIRKAYKEIRKANKEIRKAEIEIENINF